MRKRLIGGGLLLLCACIGLAAALSLLLMALADLRSESSIGLEVFGIMLGLPLTIMSIVGVVGGVFALVGRAWFFVLLAGGLAVWGTALPEAFLYPVGPFLAIIAVILLATARSEFRALDGKSEPWP
jgi:hypothetical protein